MYCILPTPRLATRFGHDVPYRDTASVSLSHTTHQTTHTRGQAHERGTRAHKLANSMRRVHTTNHTKLAHKQVGSQTSLGARNGRTLAETELKANKAVAGQTRIDR